MKTRSMLLMLSACTSCHAAYRQEVLSEEGYRAATGQTPPYAR